MSLFFPIARSHRQFQDAASEYRRLATELTDEKLYGINEGVSHWAPANHIYHIGFTSGKILKFFHKVIDGEWKEQPGRMKAIAWPLLVFDYFPRGKAKNPFDMPEQPPRQDLLAMYDQLEASYRPVGENLAALGVSPAKGKHPAIGMLTPTQYLRFMVVHAHHHLRIMRDILPMGEVAI